MIFITPDANPILFKSNLQGYIVNEFDTRAESKTFRFNEIS